MIGQTISHYKIIEKLGEGGMGVVYKAQDTRLDRFIALKFLPAHLITSGQDKARFIQEARAASALNHPNVCTIHDIQEHDGQMFIVMEFVDGQTLRDKKGSINFKQAIDIGIQIADGLAAAHEKGIVHRDIKPENIMVRKDGITQIMDFGLAKLRGTVSRLTKEGSTVGTAGYMSPEQVQGQDADHRSDIFSFGVLLYELFTGQLPFRGVHETALAYEIVNVDAAPMSAVLPAIDPSIDAIVLECLEKDPRERTQSVAQVSLDLKRFRRESSRQRASRITAARPVLPASARDAAAGPEQIALQPTRGAHRLPWFLAGVFLLTTLAAISFLVLSRQPMQERRTTRALVLPPGKANFNIQVGGHLALSPDGLTIAFVATDTAGVDLVWLRPVNTLTAIPLQGTEDATYPFWSYDSRSVAFFSRGKLKKIDAKGGPTLTICDAPSGRGGTWSQSGVIVFSSNSTGSLSKVPAGGGVPEEATSLDTTKREQNHRWPSFLPDGNHFLYVTQTSNTSNDNDPIKIGSLDRTVDSVIMRGTSNIEYASGYLIFIRQSTLMAQPFDASKCAFTGDAVPIADRVQYAPARSRGMFSTSRTGELIFQTGDPQELEIALYDRSGTRVALIPERGANWIRFSPDGRSIAFARLDPQSRNSDIWIRDIARQTSSRLTFDPAAEIGPAWSPGGDTIAFSSNRKGRFDLYFKNANGTGDERLVLESNLDKYIMQWSPDGKYLSFGSAGDPKTKWDQWILPLFGEKKPVAFLRTDFSEFQGRFSPSGRWLAYMSDESGRNEVYVRAADGSGGKWQVSTNGGIGPFFSPDGKEVYYVSVDRKLMSARVHETGSTFAVDSVVTLFDFESRGIVGTVIEDLSPDGRAFLVRVTELRQASPPITLVVNWDEELKKR